MRPWEESHRPKLGRSRSSERGQRQSSRTGSRKWRTQSAERWAELRQEDRRLDELELARLEQGFHAPTYDPFRRLEDEGQERYELELRRRKRRLRIYVKGFLCALVAIAALWLVVEASGSGYRGCDDACQIQQQERYEQVGAG
jgi:hypothetical protein